MPVTAYVVLFLDVTAIPAKVKGAGIFSEPRPTVATPHTRLANLFSVEAETYDMAADLAWVVLSSDDYGWLGNVFPWRKSRVAPT
jgi:hypothetical protein